MSIGSALRVQKAAGLQQGQGPVLDLNNPRQLLQHPWNVLSLQLRVHFPQIEVTRLQRPRVGPPLFEYLHDMQTMILIRSRLNFLS